MKKTGIIMCALALLASTSCRTELAINEATPAPDGRCVLKVRTFLEESTPSRALAAYVTPKAYETAVNNLQLLAFNEQGDLAAIVNLGSSVGEHQIEIAYGRKSVYVVANKDLMDGISSENQFLESLHELGFNSKTASVGFLMFGHAYVTLNSATATVNVPISRICARVALSSVTNELPMAFSNVVLHRVYLANVPAAGTFNMDIMDAPKYWYNKEGRADKSPRSEENVIDGSVNKASAEALTFWQGGSGVYINTDETEDFGGEPLLFYSYPNPWTAEPTGYHDTFDTQKTVLVVEMSIEGTTYYYPVVLNTLARNTAYTVALTIRGLGSGDPVAPVSKGTITANVTVSGWGTGAVYDEII